MNISSLEEWISENVNLIAFVKFKIFACNLKSDPNNF